MTEWDARHEDCPKLLADGMAKQGIEVTVSTEEPLVVGPYTISAFVCPHGTKYWFEPTGEQIAQWAKDGVR